MSRTATILVCASLLSASAAAQSGAQTAPGDIYGAMPSTGNSDMAWSYGPDPAERNATKVLARLRELCSSDHHYDQYYCARGMKAFKKGYAEFLQRRAATATE